MYRNDGTFWRHRKDEFRIKSLQSPIGSMVGTNQRVFALLSRPDTNLQKMPISQKIIFFQLAKLSYLRQRKPARTH